jgi:hypothetical protein
MSLIGDAVSSLRTAERAALRAEAATLLQQAAALLGEALELWAAHLDDPVVLDAQRSVTTLVRPDRARRLNDLGFAMKPVARRLTELSGVTLMDAFDVCEELAIALAYRQLRTGETVADITAESHALMQQRLTIVRAAITALGAR